MRVEFGKMGKIFTQEVIKIAEVCLLNYVEKNYNETDLEGRYLRVTRLTTNELSALFIDEEGYRTFNDEISLDDTFKCALRNYFLED